jgi:hypothetical protein
MATVKQAEKGNIDFGVDAGIGLNELVVHGSSK